MTILRDSSSSGDNSIPLVILTLVNRLSIKEFFMLSLMTCCEIKVLVDEDTRDLLLKFYKRKKKRAHKTHILCGQAIIARCWIAILTKTHRWILISIKINWWIKRNLTLDRDK